MENNYGFEEVTFRGIPAMFTSLRIKKEDIPEGMYRYELREEGGEVCQLSACILVDHFGTLLTSRPIQLPMLTCLDCCGRDLSFIMDGCRSLQDFLKKYPSVPEDTIRWFKPRLEDNALFYSQSGEADAACGCIGHLRGDFFHSERLQTTWWPHHWDKVLNDEEFKKDLERVMDWLKSSFAPLQDVEALRMFCRRQDEFGLPDQDRGACGVRIETPHYRYMLRCLPQEDDYNAYLYCYSKETVDRQEVK